MRSFCDDCQKRVTPIFCLFQAVGKAEGGQNDFEEGKKKDIRTVARTKYMYSSSVLFEKTNDLAATFRKKNGIIPT